MLEGLKEFWQIGKIQERHKTWKSWEFIHPCFQLTWVHELVKSVACFLKNGAQWGSINTDV